MKILQDRRLFDPARTLHKFWLSILEAASNEDDGGKLSDVFAFGPAGWGIGVVDTDVLDRPVIGFGQIWKGSSSVYTHFRVAADGRFMLERMWGYERRTIIAQSTFLDWGYKAGRYQWFVDLGYDTVQDGRYYGRYMSGNPKLGTWKEPVPYLSEAALGANQWHNPWWALEPDNNASGWKIVPTDQTPPGGTNDEQTEALTTAHWRDVWERYNRTREFRYRKEENAWRASQGMKPLRVNSRSEPAPRVTHDGEVVVDDAAVHLFAAHFDVSLPANSTPLIREAHEEALNDNNLD